MLPWSGCGSWPVSEDTEVMAAHVLSSNERLNHGAASLTVLEDLWRAAYACGVARGQKAKADSLARHPSTGAYAGGMVPRTQGEWVWGTHADLEPGSVFRYGGTDRVRPVADREATVNVKLVKGRYYMTLHDTGENVPLPVMLWVRR
jgi:hypothetical protein